jgi:hypothetical protein
MDTRLTLVRRDTQSEVIIRFETSDHAMAALAHNERVQVYYPLGSAFMVRPMVEHLFGMGWLDATLEYKLYQQRVAADPLQP